MESSNYIYFLHSDYGVKIGKSKTPDNRISLLATQMPFKINHTEIYKVSDMDVAEKTLHKHFHHLKLNGEWFNLNSQKLNEAKVILDQKFSSKAYVKPKIKSKKIFVQICIQGELAKQFYRLAKNEYAHLNNKSLVVEMVRKQVATEIEGIKE